MKHFDITKCSCADCGSKDIFVKNKERKYRLFPEGDPDSVIMKVMIPVFHCKSCEFQWYNYLAEDIMMKAEEPYRDAKYGKKNTEDDIKL